MKFIIEPINDTECCVVDIDCSDLKGETVKEVTIPSVVEDNGKSYQVKEVGRKPWYEEVKSLYGSGTEKRLRLPKGCCFASTETSDTPLYTIKFSTLKQLKKIIISEGIERVNVVMGNRGSNAKERGNADYLTEVVLPSTLKEIGEWAFANCPKLERVNVPDSVEVIEDSAFLSCKSLPLFQWPTSLRKVNLEAFRGQSAPEDNFTLIVPESIEEISGSMGTDDFNGIDNVQLSAKTWPVVDKSYLCGYFIHLRVPMGAEKITWSGNYGKKFLSEGYVEVPSTIKMVDANVFNKTKLTADSDTMHRLMGMPGALNNTLLEEIDIPEGTSTVWVEECPNLKRLIIPNTVTTIKKIKECPEIEELVIPDSVVEIGKRNPDNWTQKWDCGLKSLKAKIIASAKVWEIICNLNGLSIYNPKQTDLVIPEGVEHFNARFYQCGFTSVVFPSSVKEMCGTFEDCDKIESITFPVGEVKYGEKLVDRCKNLKYVIFPADEVSKASYPSVLGKKVDWYVPDNMVAHVKQLIKDKKVDAKNAKPLSKLAGYSLVIKADEQPVNTTAPTPSKSAPAKKKATPKKQILTKQIRLTTPNQIIQDRGIEVEYVFPVSEEDTHMLDNGMDTMVLAMQYLRTRLDECSLRIKPSQSLEFDIYEGNTKIGEWRSYIPRANKWDPRVKYKVTSPLTLSAPQSLPEDFPTESIDFPDLNTFLGSRMPAIGCKLPKASAYIHVSVNVRMNVEFMIDEKEAFSDKKLRLLEDTSTGRIVPFCLIYGKRYIPATAIVDIPKGSTVNIRTSNDGENSSYCTLSVGPDKCYVRSIKADAASLPLLDQYLKAISI